MAINALDLPSLHSQPSFETLVHALESLTINPSTWSASAGSTIEPENTAATSRYLTFVLKNSFSWLQDPSSETSHGLVADEQRERLWDMASQRLTERCGRTAQGEISRTWTIPGTAAHPDLEIVIREPPLTGDNLGFKTWGTAWAIAQKLHFFQKEYFSHILSPTPSIFTAADGTSLTLPAPTVLELGSGTSLLGIAAAAAWRADVVLTDMEIIQENLRVNASKNEGLLNARGASVMCDVLDWTDGEGALPQCSQKQFEMIIVSDPLYDDEHPVLVAAMIQRHVKPDKSSRVLVAVPLRDANTARMAKQLWGLMELNGFKLVGEGWEICRDDWTNVGEEVRCWWGVWSL